MLKRLLKATCHSFDGLKFAWKNEFAFRLEVLISIAALIVAILFAPSDIIYLMTPLVILMAFELCNTCIEKTIDVLGRGEVNNTFKAVKDCASAAVFLMILWTVVTWVRYFWKG